ncbi:CBS domain-containing protein [Haloferula sp.]|uniref:CBS domain-containing protein n=1 Tax=Haloferula sp. TaxID=2497595 RepID=UPI00329B204E
MAVKPEATIKKAAKEMRKAKIGALLVMRDKRLIGILTERDVLNKVVAEGLSPEDVRVEDIMTTDVVVIKPGRSVRDAMRIVTQKHLRHLPVVDGDHLVGVVSGGDLTRSIVAEDEVVIESLHEYIRGAYPG